MAQLFFGGDGKPLLKPEDVICYLAKREKHWKEGRSAYELAYSWFTANDIPRDIREILSDDPAFEGATLERAIFENKTELDKHGHGSQTDLLAFLKTSKGNAVIAIEAKVDETFGPLVSEWNNYGTGKLRRLAGLLDVLKFGAEEIGGLRYQLFHRVAATVLETKKVGARNAAMIVQSFDSEGTGFPDFQKFAAAFGAPVLLPGRLSSPKELNGMKISLGWTQCPLYSATT